MEKLIYNVCRWNKFVEDLYTAKPETTWYIALDILAIWTFLGKD